MMDQPKKMWKKIAIRAFFGGIGLAVGATAIIGAIVWYSNRPTPTPPWNTGALTASFAEMSFTTASAKTPYSFKVQFSYNVKNNTTGNYNFVISELTPMALLANGNALSKDFGSRESAPVTIEAPDFVPAGGTARITLNVPYYYPDGFTDDDKNNKQKMIDALNVHLNELHSFVIFDGANHYQLNLPKEWEKPKMADANPAATTQKESAANLPPCPANDPMGLLTDKQCQPAAPKPGAPPCPASDPAGLFTKTPCTPLPRKKTTQ